MDMKGLMESSIDGHERVDGVKHRVDGHERVDVVKHRRT